jgi:uncharacterized protein
MAKRATRKVGAALAAFEPRGARLPPVFGLPLRPLLRPLDAPTLPPLRFCLIWPGCLGMSLPSVAALRAADLSCAFSAPGHHWGREPPRRGRARPPTTGDAMIGLNLSFYTTQARRHGLQPVGEWLVAQAQKMGISGATLFRADEGFGRHRHLHAAHFFELADQPVEVQMAVSEADAHRVFLLLREEGVSLFCVKTPIEFGFTGAGGGLMLADTPRVARAKHAQDAEGAAEGQASAPHAAEEAAAAAQALASEASRAAHAADGEGSTETIHAPGRAGQGEPPAMELRWARYEL